MNNLFIKNDRRIICVKNHSTVTYYTIINIGTKAIITEVFKHFSYVKIDDKILIISNNSIECNWDLDIKYYLDNLDKKLSEEVSKLPTRYKINIIDIFYQYEKDGDISAFKSKAQSIINRYIMNNACY